MKSHATQIRLATRFALHAADDLSNMFYTTKIAPKSRQFFGIRTSLGTFRYTAMPFGFSWSPFIAHISVDEICKRALEAGHIVTHYLDDFHYFGDSQPQVDDARDFVRGLLHDAGFILNMSKEQRCAYVYEALGLQYDLLHKTVAAKPGYFKQLRLAHTRRANTAAIVSRKEVASIVGSFVFLNYAYPGSLSQLGPLIAFLAAGGVNWRKHYRYANLAPYVEAALKFYENLKPCRLQPFTSAPDHIYTDATNTQLGIVLPDNTQMAMAVPFKQIYRAEADAVSWLLQQPNLPQDFVLRIDNEALVNALLKGRSNIKEANRVCGHLLRLRALGHRIHAKWISTHHNPADAPSRRYLSPGELFISPQFAVRGLVPEAR